jgi:hypothetical protein
VSPRPWRRLFCAKVISADASCSLRQTQKAVDSARAARRKKWICFWICGGCNASNAIPFLSRDSTCSACSACSAWQPVSIQDPQLTTPNSHHHRHSRARARSLLWSQEQAVVRSTFVFQSRSLSYILPLYTPFFLIDHSMLKNGSSGRRRCGMRDVCCGTWDEGRGMGSLWAGLGMGKKMQSVHHFLVFLSHP